jgi:hypothetical protein
MSRLVVWDYGQITDKLIIWVFLISVSVPTFSYAYYTQSSEVMLTGMCLIEIVGVSIPPPPPPIRPALSTNILNDMKRISEAKI